MKSFLESFIVCFAMYSKIPMPGIKWTEKNTRYVFMFFPLVGLIISLVMIAWFKLSVYLNLTELLVSAVASCIPILVTGGMHLDGFIDTCDGIFSYADREKRLEILADPATGAFGVIYTIVYILITTGFYAQIYKNGGNFYLLLTVFTLSRAVGGAVSVLAKSAKNSGMKYAFSKDSPKTINAIILAIWVLVILAVLFLLDWKVALISVVLLAGFLTYFCRYAYKTFGGFTGDLAGFTISITEGILLLATLAGGMI